MKNKLGFTLVEILTAVVIITILTVMAVPLYEKTIERSRLTEVQSMLNRLQAAKNRAMDNMGCLAYDASKDECPKLSHLGISFTDECSSNSQTSFCSQDFKYSIAPGGRINGVCAVRRDGEYKDTTFYYYYGESGTSENEKPDFRCVGSHCNDYGLPSKSLAGLSCN